MLTSTQAHRRWLEINREDGHPIGKRWVPEFVSVGMTEHVARTFAKRDKDHRTPTNAPYFYGIATLEQSARAREFWCTNFEITNPRPDEKSTLKPELIESTWDQLRELVCSEMRKGEPAFWRLHPVEDLAGLRAQPEFRLKIEAWEALVPDLFRHATMLDAWKASWRSPQTLEAVKANLLAKRAADPKPETYLQAILEKATIGAITTSTSNPLGFISRTLARAARDLLASASENPFSQNLSV